VLKLLVGASAGSKRHEPIVLQRRADMPKPEVSLASRSPPVAVNLSSADTQAGENSPHAAISANGRFVAFDCFAANLVPGDANGVIDVFVRGPLTPRLVLLELGQVVADLIPLRLGADEDMSRGPDGWGIDQ
jgi:hypothetical protein